MIPRWATFDCYGTLIDWNAGIARELERLFGHGDLLPRYHEIEPAIEEEDPTRSYREVLTLALERLSAQEHLALPAGEEDALARSLPDWPMFPDVRPALERVRARGWRLAILSNTDADLLAASRERLGVPFDLTIVASEIGSYKPSHRHWEVFFEETHADRKHHVHVAQSHFHDIVPAHELGLRSVWINRLGERGDPAPTRELPDLERLPQTLAELVP